MINLLIKSIQSAKLGPPNLTDFYKQLFNTAEGMILETP